MQVTSSSEANQDCNPQIVLVDSNCDISKPVVFPDQEGIISKGCQIRTLLTVALFFLPD